MYRQNLNFIYIDLAYKFAIFTVPYVLRDAGRKHKISRTLLFVVEYFRKKLADCAGIWYKRSLYLPKIDTNSYFRKSSCTVICVAHRRYQKIP